MNNNKGVKNILMESECFKLSEQEQWYSNKEIFQFFEDFKSDMSEKNNQLLNQMSKLELEMAKTTTLIRDYNGLRQKIDCCEKEIAQIRTSRLTEKETKKDGRDWIGWVVAVGMFILAIADRFIK